jgi:prolyl-tRNA editing enzyme YbaK/EbsC (Cys-tRNA(Pro) deacylase)
LAQVEGHEKVRMAEHSEAEKLTGVQVGGIAPLELMVNSLPVCRDAAIE